MKRVARIGVIGAGWWAAENHLPILARRDDVELAGICRLGAEELERVRARFGVPFATESATELLREVPLDGVLVTSPHAEHYQHARAALEHDCHVLVEKPLATRAVDARQLVALARAREREILDPPRLELPPLHPRSAAPGAGGGHRPPGARGVPDGLAPA